MHDGAVMAVYKIILAIALFIVTDGLAKAAEISSQTNDTTAFIFLGGEIVDGDNQRLLAVMEQLRAKPEVVLLSSPGGSALEGVRLAILFQQSRATVAVLKGQECASACAIAYLGGAVRIIQRGAHLGLHAPYLPGIDTSPFVPAFGDYGGSLAFRTARNLQLRVALTNLAKQNGISQIVVDLMFRELSPSVVKYIEPDDGIKLGLYTKVIE
jgi:hypothetical protein